MAENSPDDNSRDKKGAKRKSRPVTAVASSTPPDATPDSDPGDETQRRFRYQHAYGVIILIAAARRILPYQSIWCEHHDDFIARHNGQFDSYQVKTAKSEHGPWQLNSDGLRDAFRKFITLDQRFPAMMRRFHFVSNLGPLDTHAKTKIDKSPLRLREAVNTASDVKSMSAPFAGVVKELATIFGTPEDGLFNVLKRVEYLIGPSLEDFEAAVSHDHVGKYPDCVQLTQSQVNAIRDELIQIIFNASSRTIADPAKHWCCIGGPVVDDPWIKAKEIAVSVVEASVRQEHVIPFRFSPAASLIAKRNADGQLTTFEKKLIKGGLIEQLDTMRRRTLSAERHLLTLAAKDLNKASTIQNQVENVVQGICDDSRLNAAKNPEPYGKEMLREVLERLRETANNRAGMVCQQEYECLAGIAGLLTEGCSVWWSDKFDLGKAV